MGGLSSFCRSGRREGWRRMTHSAPTPPTTPASASTISIALSSSQTIATFSLGLIASSVRPIRSALCVTSTLLGFAAQPPLSSHGAIQPWSTCRSAPSGLRRRLSVPGPLCGRHGWSPSFLLLSIKPSRHGGMAGLLRLGQQPYGLRSGHARWVASESVSIRPCVQQNLHGRGARASLCERLPHHAIRPGDARSGFSLWGG